MSEQRQTFPSTPARLPAGAPRSPLPAPPPRAARERPESERELGAGRRRPTPGTGVTPQETFTSPASRPGTRAWEALAAPALSSTAGQGHGERAVLKSPRGPPTPGALSPGLQGRSAHKRGGPAKLSRPYLAGCHPPPHPQDPVCGRPRGVPWTLPAPARPDKAPAAGPPLASLRTRAAALLPGPRPERRRRHHFPRPWQRGSWQRGSWRSGSERR